MKKYRIVIVEKKAFYVEVEAKSKEHARGLAKDYYDKGNYANVEKRLQEPKIINRGMENV